MDDKRILQNPVEEEKTIEVTFEEDDPMNPKLMSTARKWLIVTLVNSSSLCVTVTASLYTSTYDQMNAELGSTRILATLGLTTYAFGLGLGPMLVGPLSEFYGRRPIYLISLSLFVIWLIPCALAHNIQTVIVARFLGGFAGSAFLSVAGGTVGDLFTKDKLQQPMLVFTAAPLMGPSSGTLLGGFINYNLNWRWSFYILLMWASAQTLAVAAAVPETYAPVVLRNKAKKLRKETGDERYKAAIEVTEKSISRTVLISLYRPFQLLTLDPMCLSLCLLSALLLGILYLFFGAFNVVFKEVYDFNLWQVGCSFLGIMTGMLFGIASDPLWHKIYNRLLDRTEKETGIRTSEPEFRLPSAIFGAWLCVIGMFWFAWTTIPSIHWIVPIIGTAFFGCGILLVFEGIFTFLVEAFPLYAASALAANSFTRNTSSGAL